MMNVPLTNPAKNPCKECAKRSAWCHGSCAEYQKYRKDVDEFNAKRRAANVSYVDM